MENNNRLRWVCVRSEFGGAADADESRSHTHPASGIESLTDRRRH